jgi:hypothetical protein
MGWYLTGQCVWYIVFVVRRDRVTLDEALAEIGPAVSLALAGYGLLGSLYPFALVSYHFYLVFTGQNTHEYVFSSYSQLTKLRNKSMVPRERGKPYNRGNAIKNFFAVLCWPKPITYGYAE